MIYYPYSFFNKLNSNDIHKVAADMAVLAHGLLGKVDRWWTQEVSDAGVTMHFLTPVHASEFLSRWTSLTRADWNCSLPQIPGPEAQSTPQAPARKHTCTIILPFDVTFKESCRIEADLLAEGVWNADRFDLSEDAVNGMLDKLVYLARGLEINDWEFEPYEDGQFDSDDGDLCDLFVKLTFGNRAEMESFVCAVERLGWGKRTASGSARDWMPRLPATLQDMSTTQLSNQ